MSEVRLYDPAKLDSDKWRQLQTIEREAFDHTLDRSQAEIDELVGWNDPERFRLSHLDPNTEVGRHYNANQSYTRPKVAVATENSNSEPIGFAYSARNVSGSSEGIRLMKKLSVVKNYLWVREIAVKPEHQQRGVAKSLGRTLLRDAISLQPVTAYAWPDEDPDFMQSTLEKLGFVPTDEQQVKLFGANSDPVRQVRMEAASVRTVLKNIG